MTPSVKTAPPPSLANGRSPFSQAFTILELLVATAVMALMLVLLLQITNHTMQASKMATQQMDATQSARQVLDVLTSDIAHAVLTDGATILTQDSGGAPALAFLDNGRGSDTTPARFLAISYKLANNQLTRSYKAVGWEDIPGTHAGLLQAAEVTAPDFTSVLSSGILQFSVLAVLEDGSMVSLYTPPTAPGALATGTFEGQPVPAGWTALVPSRPPAPSLLSSSTARVRALLVAIASVDEQNFELLNTAQKSLFANVPAAASDPVAGWEATLQSSALPGPARAAIRFQSKVIPFP